MRQYFNRNLFFICVLASFCIIFYCDLYKLHYAYQYITNNRETEFIPPFVHSGVLEFHRRSEKYNLDYCVIAKCMSTKMLNFMSLIINADKNKEETPQEIVPNVSKTEYTLWPALTRTQYKNWTLIAVIRNPLERFVSGFTDQCVLKRKNGVYACYGCMSDLKCFIGKLYDRLLAHAAGHVILTGHDDHHFYPLTWQCAFYRLLDRYHLIHYSSNRSDIAYQLQNMLEKTKVPSSVLATIKADILKRNTKHATQGTYEAEKVRFDLENDRNLMRRFILMFYYDYLLFNYDLPQI